MLQLQNFSYYHVKNEHLKIAVHVYAYIMHCSSQIPLET